MPPRPPPEPEPIEMDIAVPSPPGGGKTSLDVENINDNDASTTRLPAESTLGEVEAELEARGEIKPVPERNVLATLPTVRKHVLLFVFCMSMFIDGAGATATFLMTAPIAADLGIGIGNQAWILGSYSLAYAAMLLFAGRLADLYPPSVVYTVGFAGQGIFYLILSFMEDQYAFLVLRAFCGMLAVLTIPSSINMIVQTFPRPDEQGRKLGLFALAGALSNTLGMLLAGVFVMASWRWYFRFVAIVVLPFSVLAWFLMPRTQAVAESLPGMDKVKRMDIGGVLLLMAFMVLFILAFTQGVVDGWGSPIFIVPLVVSLVILPCFLLWEKKMPRGYSLLPHDIWKFPNIFPLVLQSTGILMWFATYELRAATYFQDVLHDSPILAAAKLVPIGVVGIIAGYATQACPKLITRPRYVQPVASVLCFIGSMLLAFSGGGHGVDYWKYIFTGQIIGCAGGMVVFIGMNTCVIQSFPVEFAGIGGSFVNVVFQLGSVVGVAVQSGLLATGDGTIDDWSGSQNGYYFSSAYVLVTGIVFLVWYRQDKMPSYEPKEGDEDVSGEVESENGKATTTTGADAV